jgi:hypothetical protein
MLTMAVLCIQDNEVEDIAVAVLVKNVWKEHLF